MSILQKNSAAVMMAIHSLRRTGISDFPQQLAQLRSASQCRKCVRAWLESARAWHGAIGAGGSHLAGYGGLSWPEDIYSLAHVALPFPADDPLYGGHPPEKSPGLHLGELTLRDIGIKYQAHVVFSACVLRPLPFGSLPSFWTESLLPSAYSPQ